MAIGEANLCLMAIGGKGLIKMNEVIMAREDRILELKNDQIRASMSAKKAAVILTAFFLISLTVPAAAGELMEYIADYNRSHSPTPPPTEAAAAYIQDQKDRGTVWKDMEQFKQRLPRIAVVADGENLLEIFATSLNAAGYTEEAAYVFDLDHKAKYPENMEEAPEGHAPDQPAGSGEVHGLEQDLTSDSLVLTNGQTLHGRVVEESAQGVLFESDGGQVFWSKAEIKKLVKA